MVPNQTVKLSGRVRGDGVEHVASAHPQHILKVHSTSIGGWSTAHHTRGLWAPLDSMFVYLHYKFTHTFH